MPNPVYSYRWWDEQRKRTPLEWQQGRSLLLFAAAAVFPVGRASLELPPARVATPVAVGWQAPNNRVLQLLQPVTIASGQSVELPRAASSRVSLDVTQGRNFQLFAQPASAFPVGGASTNSLSFPGSLGPALTFTGSGTPTPQVVTIPSAFSTDLPVRAPPFRAADTAGIAISTPVAAALRSAQWLDLPPAPLAFRAGSVQSSPLQPQVSVIVGEAWTDIPPRVVAFRQADNWSLPLQFVTPTLRSAQSIDLPTRAPPFRAADVTSTIIPPAPPAALRSASQLDVPVRLPPFRAADVRNPLLPRLEFFTGFATGLQSSLALPVLRPFVAVPPATITGNILTRGSGGNMPNLLGAELYIQATAELIKAGIVPNIGLVSNTSTPNLLYFGVWTVQIIWVKSNARPGIVVGQDPPAGSTVAFGAPIVLTVASFPMSVSSLYTGGAFS